MGLEWIFFFLRFSVVFAFCLCFCFFVRFVFPPFFFVFLLFSFFFVRIFVSFYSFQELLVFSAHFQAVAVDCPSVFGYGETAKACKNKEFHSDPVYTNPVRYFPSDAPFSRLRPNDPSSGLTNDTREDPTTESHRPIAKKNPRKYFGVMWATNIAKLIISEFFDGCNIKNVMVYIIFCWGGVSAGFPSQVSLNLRVLRAGFQNRRKKKQNYK